MFETMKAGFCLVIAFCFMIEDRVCEVVERERKGESDVRGSVEDDDDKLQACVLLTMNIRSCADCAV